MPSYLEPALLESSALETAYIDKMFLVPFNRDQDHSKIGNPTFEEVKEKRQDFWSLMSLKNPDTEILNSNLCTTSTEPMNFQQILFR
eukprot:TRINITY_DN1293_c0_g1_i2.p1 TRINITY_DN1293_c0_g1~~TRINITY_DN1293_c0_g1_i2.p1  ORF type:complete len:87 (+),score=16.59 TRINITY_DN1293_c0_g1_i2:163-423(+)